MLIVLRSIPLVGGIWELRKIAAQAEAREIGIAPYASRLSLNPRLLADVMWFIDALSWGTGTCLMGKSKHSNPPVLVAFGPSLTVGL